MATLKKVRELALPVLILEANVTVAEALKKLEQAKTTFGVISDERGQPLGLVTVEQLHAAQKDVSVNSLIVTTLRPTMVEPSVTIDDVVKMLAKDLVLNPDLSGVIVQDQGKVQSVLPRKTIVEYASRVVIRGTIDRLEGAPVDMLFFECPEGHERKLVAYYDPQNPPKCSKGHLMKPVES